MLWRRLELSPDGPDGGMFKSYRRDYVNVDYLYVTSRPPELRAAPHPAPSDLDTGQVRWSGRKNPRGRRLKEKKWKPFCEYVPLSTNFWPHDSFPSLNLKCQIDDFGFVHQQSTKLGKKMKIIEQFNDNNNYIKTIIHDTTYNMNQSSE